MFLWDCKFLNKQTQTDICGKSNALFTPQGGALGISIDKDDRMEPKVKTQKSLDIK